MAPVHPVFAAGTTALITGGASGIGLAMAKYCHSHHMNLALVDKNPSALSSTLQTVFHTSPPHSSSTTTIPSNAPLVKTYVADVSKLEDWSDLRAKVEMDFGRVGFLMLNAGVQPQSSWEDIDAFEKTINTNFWGTFYGIRTFLPSLRTQTTPTAIVITGSKNGITNPPGNPAYNASKAAINTLAEHLSFDLRHTPTSVHLLLPGWTWTEMTRLGERRGVGGEKADGAWEPEQVVAFFVERMAEGGFYVFVPDNEVSGEMDKKRLLWRAGDMVEGRPPLSRWRERWGEECREWMDKVEV